MAEFVRDKSAGSPQAVRVLIVEDNPSDVELVAHELEKAGFAVQLDVAASLEQFAEQLRSREYDFILADYKLPGWRGTDALSYLQQQGKDIPFILVSGTLADQDAAEYIDKGITDYVLKDRLSRLPLVVRRALQQKELRAARQRIRILFVEDNPTDVDVCVAALRRGGFEPQGDMVKTQDEFTERLQTQDYDVILADYRLPRWTGMTALSILKELGKDIPFILVTGVLGDEMAAQCVSEGVADYVLKDRLGRLPLAVQQALEERTLRLEATRAAQVFRESQERLRLQGAALESAASAILICDREGCILWSNAAFTGLTGYTSQEVLGKNPRILKSDHHDVSFYRNLWETILAGEVWRGELTNRRKDGSLYVEEQTITPLRDSHGNITHFIGIKQDISERKRNQDLIAHQFKELEQERAKLRALSRRLLHVQEEERRRLGRELHDQVGQLLTAIRLNLALFQQNQPGVVSRDARRLPDALGMIDQCLDHIRNLSYLLRPPLLEEAGLLSAVRWFLERYTKLTAIRVDSALADSLPRMPQEFETAIFRVLQESLTNVTRHAQTTAVQVELKSIDRQLRLVVADQGRGFDPAEVLHSQQAGVGLIGMQERMRELGGKLEIEAGPGQGTRVCATLPLPEGIG